MKKLALVCLSLSNNDRSLMTYRPTVKVTGQ